MNEQWRAATAAPGGTDRSGVATANRGRRGRRWRTLLVGVVGLVGLLLAASGCQLVELDGGGLWVRPDAPSGRRLLIVGDSLIRGNSLATAFPLTPAGVETLVEATNMSGLVSGPVHWDARSVELVSQFRPTVVLISFGGNFAAPYWGAYAPPGPPGSAGYDAWIAANWGSKDWLDRNVAAAVAATRGFASGGARVYWLEPPPMPPQYGSPSVRDKLWARLSAELPTLVPGTRLLSANASVTDAAGRWVATKAICGAVREIRTTAWDGGVHFTPDGTGTFGRATARALSAAEGWPAPPAHCPGLPD